jgi:hypothetical protein
LFRSVELDNAWLADYMIVFLGLTLELGFIGFTKLLDQFLSFYFVQILV